MAFIDRNLLQGERIIFRTKKHIIVFYVPFVFFIAACLFCLDIPLIKQMNNTINSFTYAIPGLQHIERLPALFFLLLSLYAAIRPYLLYSTSDYVVTNARIIMREGFFDRRVADTRLGTVSHVTVDQGPLGQMLDFGNVAINGYGGNSDYFTQIAKPNEFQRSVNLLLNVPLRK